MCGPLCTQIQKVSVYAACIELRVNGGAVWEEMTPNADSSVVPFRAVNDQ